jgi:hypothetical protein
MEIPEIFDGVRCDGCRKQTVDPQGTHHLTCTSGGNELWIRHQQTLQAIHVATKTTQKISQITDLHGILPDKTRRDGKKAELIPDQLVMQFSPTGRDLLTDVTVVLPIAHTYIKKAVEPLGAAKEREQEKNVKDGYLAAAQTVGKDFLPLALEVYGAWGPGLQTFFAQLKQIMKNKLPQDSQHTWTSSSWASYHSQQIAIALQKGNAASILQRAHRDFRRSAHYPDGTIIADYQQGD